MSERVVILEGRAFVEEELYCPDCQSVMHLAVNRSQSGPPRYTCSSPGCGATHEALLSGRPSGWPGDAETRQARHDAHEEFNRLWTEFGMQRDRAYRFMASVMGLSREDAHISKFTAAQCYLLIQRLKHAIPTRRKP